VKNLLAETKSLFAEVKTLSDESGLLLAEVKTLFAEVKSTKEVQRTSSCGSENPFRREQTSSCGSENFICGSETSICRSPSFNAYIPFLSMSKGDIAIQKGDMNRVENQCL
jgi:hypothetical protein